MTGGRTVTGAVETAPQLQLLSGFLLRSRGTRLELPERAQRLLALLGLRGRMRRAQAAGLLWPESSQQQAHASLRTTVWRCQKACPGLLVASPNEVALDPEVTVDVRDLVSTAVRVLRQDGVPVESDPDRLWLLCSDELLPGWYDDWVLSEREVIRQLSLHALHVAAESLAAQGRLGAAIQVALQGLRIDPLRESAHRLVIELHLAEGNVSEARRQYEACCRLMWSELGVGPSPQLRELVTWSLVPSEG